MNYLTHYTLDKSDGIIEKEFETAIINSNDNLQDTKIAERRLQDKT